MQVQVTIDVFSGRPNPTWMLDEKEAQEVLRQVAGNAGVLEGEDRSFQVLGFRAVQLEILSDHDAEAFGLPSTFRIAHGGSHQESKSLEIAERLVSGMLRAVPAAHAQGVPTLDAALQQFLVAQLVRQPTRAVVTAQDGTAADPLQAQLAAATCFIELGKFNPAFWNDPAVIGHNNCYNYGTNRRTNTFAQPGRATGHQYTALTCPAVSQAALSDGNHVRFNCFPEPEKPRWLMALVMAPGIDYHWYRKQLEGFWGHKPGGTAARNVDNAGQVIYDPRTAARGMYTEFCGFFYSCKDAKVQ